MARQVGTAGTASVGGAISGVTKWDLTYEADVLETTGMDSAGVAAYLGGITRWSGSVTAHQDAAGTKHLGNFAVPGTIVAVALLTAAGGSTYSGNAVIRSIKPEVSFDGTVDYTLEFQGTGALTIA